MGSYPYLVQIVWDVLDQFIRDWQREPYRWSKESETQSELYCRLQGVYEKIGYGRVEGNYDAAPSGFRGLQTWNRVSCNHDLGYTDEEGERQKCIPDIIVWDEIEDPDNPPDVDGSRNWPMLWVCEIKHNSQESVDWDIEKMGRLLTQGDVDHACCLEMKTQHAESGSGIDWKMRDDVQVCRVRLPPIDK